MIIENKPSWQITISNDYILNFIIYTGCAYGFIDGKTDLAELEIWPEKYLGSELEKSLAEELKKQWEKCFNETLHYRGKCVASRNYDLADKRVTPSGFFKPRGSELEKCFENTWEDFLKWWNIGGQNSLSLYEYRGEDVIYKYIKEFEKKNNREIKPFHLYIDLVYCKFQDILEVNNEYIVITPVGYSLYKNEEWWTKKLDEIG